MHDTHYATPIAPTYHRGTPAESRNTVCGRTHILKQHLSETPTCPACREWLKTDHEHLETAEEAFGDGSEFS